MPQCGEGESAVRVSILSIGLQDLLFVPVVLARPLTTFDFSFVVGGLVFRFLCMPVVTVTRLLKFNAAHRVHNPKFSDEENNRIFGKCNNPNWHGHNYQLEVSVRGEVDPDTGYVIDLSRLKELVERTVIDRTDHRNFNIDVDYMRGINPTTENIVVAMWREIAPAIAPAKLVQLRLWETDNNFVDYYGD